MHNEDREEFMDRLQTCWLTIRQCTHCGGEADKAHYMGVVRDAQGILSLDRNLLYAYCTHELSEPEATRAVLALPCRETRLVVYAILTRLLEQTARLMDANAREAYANRGAGAA